MSRPTGFAAENLKSGGIRDMLLKKEEVSFLNLQESGEMYLETIYVLSQQSSCVRSIDVADYMGYSKPSVSRALGLLKNGGYVTVDGNGFLTLTDSGRQIAGKIYERHTVLRDMLVRLGVDEKTAAADACRIEHVISEQSFDAIKTHICRDMFQTDHSPDSP